MRGRVGIRGINFFLLVTYPAPYGLDKIQPESAKNPFKSARVGPVFAQPYLNLLSFLWNKI
jgi:hypothetical protein